MNTEQQARAVDATAQEIRKAIAAQRDVCDGLLLPMWCAKDDRDAYRLYDVAEETENGLLGALGDYVASAADPVAFLLSEDIAASDAERVALRAAASSLAAALGRSEG